MKTKTTKMIVVDELKLAQQTDKYADSVCEKTSLSFYLWIKRNGWSYSESTGLWFDGMVRLGHTKVFDMFMKSCEAPTIGREDSNEALLKTTQRHAEATQNTESAT